MGTYSRLRARASCAHDVRAREALAARAAAASALERGTSHEIDIDVDDVDAHRSIEINFSNFSARDVACDDGDVRLSGDVARASECDASGEARLNESCASCAIRSGKIEELHGVFKPTSWTPCAIERERGRGRAIVVAFGDVYDATEFLKEHPSGPGPIVRAMGRDNGDDFQMHSKNAKKIWEKFKVGRLEACAERGFGMFEPPREATSMCTIS